MKAISLGLLVTSITVAAIYLYFVLAGKDDVNVYFVVAISFMAIGLLYTAGRITFGQVVEKNHDGQIAIYYKLGKLKLRYRTLGRLMQATLEQDAKRYYCLTIKTTQENIVVLEKYATLNEANQRLTELQTQVD